MTAYMIPMRVCCNSCNRLFGNLFYLFSDFADSKPCVYQKTTLDSYQKIAMSFFGMSVFAYDVCFVIDIFNRKPFFHFSPDNKAKISVAKRKRIFFIIYFLNKFACGISRDILPSFHGFLRFLLFQEPKLLQQSPLLHNIF